MIVESFILKMIFYELLPENQIQNKYHFFFFRQLHQYIIDSFTS